MFTHRRRTFSLLASILLTTNNIPSGFDSTLFDDPDSDGLGNGEDLKLYQGGDWQGIMDKIP